MAERLVSRYLMHSFNDPEKQRLERLNLIVKKIQGPFYMAMVTDFDLGLNDLVKKRKGHG